MIQVLPATYFINITAKITGGAAAPKSAVFYLIVKDPCLDTILSSNSSYNYIVGADTSNIVRIFKFRMTDSVSTTHGD